MNIWGKRRNIPLTDDALIVGFAAKNLSNHGHKGLEWFHRKVWIKTGLIPPFTKFSTRIKKWMISELIARVFVPAIMVGVIQHLKNAMMFNGPGNVPSHKWSDNFC
jgi:hypothetical protein